MTPPLPRFLIIDGHSVIHAWPDLLKLHRASTRRNLAREELLKKMRNLQDMTGERVVVVFDGKGASVTEEREAGGLQIFYADPGTTADTVVERLAAKHAAKNRLRVCSADGMVRDSVLASGADWISPETLRHDCDQADAEMRKFTK